MYDVYVRHLKLPYKIKGVTLPDDCGYDVYINSLLSEEQQKKALQHELKHIKLNHFYDEEPVMHNEQEAG